MLPWAEVSAVCSEQGHVCTKAWFQDKQKPSQIKGWGTVSPNVEAQDSRCIQSCQQGCRNEGVWGERAEAELQSQAGVSPPCAHLQFILGRLWMHLNGGLNDQICVLELSGSSSEGGCYELNVCVPPQCVLKPSVMVLGGGAFGRCLGCEGRDLMNGICALIKETQRNPPCPLPPCEVTGNRRSSGNQKVGPHQVPHLLAPWLWASQPPELWEINLHSQASSLWDSVTAAWTD